MSENNQQILNDCLPDFRPRASPPAAGRCRRRAGQGGGHQDFS